MIRHRLLRILEMIETAEGFDMVDRIVQESNLPGGGAYTAVGTYDHAELVSLLVAYGRIKDRGVDVILREFGQHLFRRFVILFPRFFVNVKSSFDFLEHIESYIHVEVKKLYPDAELPRFEHRRLADGSLELISSSQRHLPDFAEGPMIGCIDHFGDRIELRREPVMLEGARSERFILSRKDQELGNAGDRGCLDATVRARTGGSEAGRKPARAQEPRT